MNKRKGHDPRGHCHDRLKRKVWLLWKFGDGRQCKCTHCPKILTLETLTQDRIVPGGSYRRSNIQPSCLACNIRRGDSPITPYPAS